MPKRKDNHFSNLYPFRVENNLNHAHACNKLQYIFKICPEMHAKKILELYDRHHKVSPNLNSY